MCTQLYLGCSGWNYGDTSEKGGWLNVFYPDNKTRKLSYYSQFFNTVEIDQFLLINSFVPSFSYF